MGRKVILQSPDVLCDHGEGAKRVERDPIVPLSPLGTKLVK